MYADTITDSMNEAINETKRRRAIQEEYNIKHNIIPKTIIKEIHDIITNEDNTKEKEKKTILTKAETQKMINNLTKEMKEAASRLDFEKATELRDIIFELKSN